MRIKEGGPPLSGTFQTKNDLKPKVYKGQCIPVAFDRCQWQWCEITSGFESNPILASSLNGTPLPPIENYCLVSWRAIAMENY